MISTCVLFEEVEAVDEFFIFDFGVCEVVPHADKSLLVGLVFDGLHRFTLTSSSIFSLSTKYWVSLSCSKR
jgi:hypothetical protein